MFLTNSSLDMNMLSAYNFTSVCTVPKSLLTSCPVLTCHVSCPFQDRLHSSQGDHISVVVGVLPVQAVKKLCKPFSRRMWGKCPSAVHTPAQRSFPVTLFCPSPLSTLLSYQCSLHFVFQYKKLNIARHGRNFSLGWDLPQFPSVKKEEQMSKLSCLITEINLVT